MPTIVKAFLNQRKENIFLNSTNVFSYHRGFYLLNSIEYSGILNYLKTQDGFTGCAPTLALNVKVNVPRWQKFPTEGKKKKKAKIANFLCMYIQHKFINTEM